jgi:hypothetical protein
MDPKKFKEYTDKLITIKKPRTGRSQNGQPNETHLFNPTIILNHPARPCEDCDDIVFGRRVNYFIRLKGYPQEHWIKQCVTCKRKEKHYKIPR